MIMCKVYVEKKNNVGVIHTPGMIVVRGLDLDHPSPPFSK